MSKRIAALDLGTNTFHLLIADIFEGVITRIIYSDQKHVKLGEGGISTGTITEASFSRGIEALSDFHQAIIEHKVEFIRAVGTAALRSAANGQMFIDQVKANTGIAVEIIDGDREASLIYLGVKQAIRLQENSLIMDIGGGSVEFIFANANGILWKKSYPIGAAKLMALFHHIDPIPDAEIKNIKNHLQDVLTDLKATSRDLKLQRLIGSAGAFETFAALCQIKTLGASLPVGKHFCFDLGVLNEVLEDILKSTHHQRAANPAILSVRTDMIVVASILTQCVINELKFRSVELSSFSLKEGLLAEQLQPRY
ncbi:exopolyphosphatase [Paradesertivirga mongoliensis]|uniref:Exopolyphosphatase n=1 Tax=Paradesertivirga mongoliensis TaxID=2100740 RepID=A0ABW4ZP75_9SPHI|nr:exopolyphosphatase [Pedobacter mongoliensis]